MNLEKHYHPKFTPATNFRIFVRTKSLVYLDFRLYKCTYQSKETKRVTERKKPGRKPGVSDKPYRVEVRLSEKAKGNLDQACMLSAELSQKGVMRTATSIIEDGIERELKAIKNAITEKKRVKPG